MSVFKDIVTRQKALELTSLRPIHQMCLELETSRSLGVACSSVCGHNRITCSASVWVSCLATSRGGLDVRGLAIANLPLGRKVVPEKASTSLAKVYRAKAVK